MKKHINPFYALKKQYKKIDFEKSVRGRYYPVWARVKKIKDITIDIAAEAIRARKQDARQILVIPIEKIQTEVGNFYGVSVKEMKGTRRVQNIVLARQVAMYLARELTDNSLPKIGKEFGGKDHTTVIHAHAKIKSLIDEDDNLRLEIEAIKKKIK